MISALHCTGLADGLRRLSLSRNAKSVEAFVVHKIFLELHGKTELQHSPEQLEQPGT